MTEKTAFPSITAHQQLHIPLLRRPRPPPPKVASKYQSNSVDMVDIAASTNAKNLEEMVLEEKLRTTLTPVHPLPRHHPTPSSPHRHSSTHTKHRSPTRHTTHSPIDEHCDDDLFICTADVIPAEWGVINPLSPPRGPQFFPRRKVKRTRHHSHKRSTRKGEEDVSPSKVAPSGQGEDGDIILTAAEDLEEMVLYQPPATILREKMISRQNYLKLTGWFATHVPQQASLNTLDMTVDHCAPERRRPYHQILLELEALVNSAMETMGGAAVMSGGRCEGGVGGGDSELGGEGEGMSGDRWPTPSPGDIVFQSSTSRYFCGEGRSNSPFDSGDQPLISPSEVAILESMLDGGYRLSLKAHFLFNLPHLSPLSLTLTNLNVSFNILSIFPTELLEMRTLRKLRMRNNPIRNIPNDIHKLDKLEDFCISFNLLTTLPSGLFELSSLVHLDVSHNAIHTLSEDVGKLKSLLKLNVESNELIGLPRSLLSLPLTHLLFSGNYTHPALWKENCRTPPQALVDQCCTIVAATFSDKSLPSTAKDILRCRRRANVCCGFCSGPVFGGEIKVVKPMKPNKQNFPLQSVPVLVIACSLSCKYGTIT